MDPREFITWCEGLDLNHESEVCRRNFASRYYYGLFHIVVDSFDDMPSYADLGTHSSVTEYLERGYNGTTYDRKDLKRLSYMIRQAKGFRVTADYTLNQKFSLDDCLATKASIDKCLTLLDQIINNGTGDISAASV